MPLHNVWLQTQLLLQDEQFACTEACLCMADDEGCCNPVNEYLFVTILVRCCKTVRTDIFLIESKRFHSLKWSMFCWSFASLKSTLTPVNKDLIVTDRPIMSKYMWEKIFLENDWFSDVSGCTSMKKSALYKLKFSSFLCKLIVIYILLLFPIFLCCITKQK